MKLQLRSDFQEYYDKGFNWSGEVFTRWSTAGPSRPEMLTLLDSLGYKTPPHGRIKELAQRLKDPSTGLLVGVKAATAANPLVVVYMDEWAHRGEGKVLRTLSEAINAYPNAYASLYVVSGHSIYKRSTSNRELWVGCCCFRMKYRSTSHAWKSNVGDVEITNFHEDHVSHRPKTPHALFAVDTVLDAGGTPHAIDFNIAPGVAGTGIEEVFTPREFVDELKLFLSN